jgi:hypothetical protein
MQDRMDKKKEHFLRKDILKGGPIVSLTFFQSIQV